MIYKRLFSIIAIALVLWLGVFSVASAHVQQTDGSISAVMHIDPDDEPIVGQPANFFFEFQDSQSKFKPQNCNCNVTISQNSKQLTSVQLFKTTNTADFVTSLFSYTFPQKAVYAVEVTGKPKTAGEFQPFTLDYNVRVDRQVDGSQQSVISDQPTSHLFHYILFSIAFLIILILYVKEKRKSQNSKKPGNPKSVILPMLAAIAMTGFLIHGSMIDTALCMHDHPVMSDHQCCVAPQAITVSTVSLQTQSISVKVETQNFRFQQKEFSLRENNKSPPYFI